MHQAHVEQRRHDGARQLNWPANQSAAVAAAKCRHITVLHHLQHLRGGGMGGVRGGGNGGGDERMGEWGG